MRLFGSFVRGTDAGYLASMVDVSRRSLNSLTKLLRVKTQLVKGKGFGPFRMGWIAPADGFYRSLYFWAHGPRAWFRPPQSP